MRKPVIIALALGFLALAACSLKAQATAVNADNPGQEVDIKTYLRSGLINIVDFYSEYCPPCRRISPLLEKLDQKRTDIAVIKLDINRKGITGIDWQSPLSKQYELHSIPHFKIYDGEGNLLKEGDEAYSQVVTWLQEAGIKLP